MPDSNIVVSYDGLSLIPAPMISIGFTHNQTGDNTTVGGTFTITLTGTIYASNPMGLLYTDAELDNIVNKFKYSGKNFIITCDDAVILVCNPIVKRADFQTSNNNWVMTIPYTIELEYYNNSDDDGLTTYLNSLSENWEIEFLDDKSYYSWTLPTVGLDASPYYLRLSHNVSAVGQRHYTPSGAGAIAYQPWEIARSGVIARLGYDSTKTGSGVININPALFGAYNHTRTNSIDELEGSYSVTETWLLANSGTGIPGKAVEDFTINLRKSVESAINTVSIEGQINGLETRSYGTSPGDFTITQSKYDAALEYWNAVKGRLLYRCQAAVSGDSAGTLNTTVLNNTIGYSPANGLVTYNYEYDTRPANCVSGALSEVITITDNNPTDVFANLVVLGRANGPILQDMGTVTVATRELSVEVVVAPVSCVALTSSPRSDVQTLVDTLYAELTGTYEQVFKHQDSESWSPKTGRYSRSIGWTYGEC